MKNKVLAGLLVLLCPVFLVGCPPMGVTIEDPSDGAHFDLLDEIDLKVGFLAASMCTGGDRCRSNMDWWLYIDGVQVCSGGINDGDGSGSSSWCPMTNVPAEYYCDFHWYIPTSDLGVGSHDIEIVADPNNSCHDQGDDNITIHIP